MKQLFLIAILHCTFLGLSNAQTDRGTTLLGGRASFQTSDGSSVFTASPSVGYFVLNDVVVGAGFSWFTTKGANSWAVGPFIRLYLFGTDKGKFIVQSGVNVGGARNTDTAFGFDVAAGYAAFLNESIALELLAGYTKTGDSKGIFALGAGFQIHYNR